MADNNIKGKNKTDRERRERKTGKMGEIKTFWQES